MNKYLVALCFSLSCMMAFAHEYRIEIFVGTQMEKIIPFWAHQVLTVFREYPYLYDGTTDEGVAYCKEVMGYKDAAIAVAYRDEKPVGFLSGASFVNFEDHFGNTTGFKAAHLDHNFLLFCRSDCITRIPWTRIE